MLDNIGATAVRTLGVDIANLSARLAVQTAVVENLIQMAGMIDQSTWEHDQVLNEAQETVGYTSRVPGEEMDKLQALLSAIASLQ